MLLRTPGEAPYCMVQQTGTPTSMTNSAYTAVVWDTILDDRWKMLSGGIGTSGIIVPKSGLYLCEGAVEFAANVTGRRFVAIQFNAQQWRGNAQMTLNAGNPTNSMARLMKLPAGSTITLAGFQDSGGPLNTAFSENASYLNVVWLRP